MPDVDLPARALGYASHGLELFPGDPRSKKPLVSQKLATTDPDTIRGWWAKWPMALICHRLAPEVIILDIDPRHGGDLVWAALLAGFGDDIEPQRRHHSGRNDGGFHAWYKLDGRDGTPTIHGLRAWAESHGYPELGIDLLRHDHRYTILPPSPHPATGEPYAWDIGDEPGPLPEALAEMLYALDPVEHERVEPTEGATTLAAIEHPTSPADWFSAIASWNTILEPQGWTVARGDGNADGSMWKHPKADPDHEHSASIKHGCLFVYSDGTPFDTTEGGMPRGYTRFAAFALLVHEGDMAAAARAINRLRDTVEQIDVYQPTVSVDAVGGAIDWQAFKRREATDRKWLVDGFWPVGRAVALWAAAKMGKSELALWCAGKLALGEHPWSGTPIAPVEVAYFDYEMTEDDLEERLDDFGFDLDLLGHLHYFLLPAIPPLDTEAGGKAIEGLARDVEARAVVIDTFGRSVEGEEDRADTVRDFFRHTGSRLKRDGIAYLRTDHAGKDKSKGQRGSSAKRDDVDVVWSLTRSNLGVTLDCTGSSRLSWVGPKLNLDRAIDTSGLVSYSTPMTWGGYPAGTAAKAAELDRLGIPLDLGRDKVRQALKDAGLTPGKNDVITAAIKYRKEAGTGQGTGQGDRSPGTGGDGLFDAP